ncbi:MAG: carboxylating nicotinate-nucleotide diphosphorylase [Chloroflexi bacterium]|jgi:nicotinate-nucleotide pyrophosphorylase (carboxylating)|nr:carboxylating nicotinate-nucleotide diphosphorylase [Chloroflexota bacterium]MBT7080837.1 carboxylating nicotinate-nucleotide diphosphorylase [Chloroflexota bacterium]MBT7288881.1 carboxylating nicotinate-nucleotide diphosphorylase [Chloroflexota bacterium]
MDDYLVKQAQRIVDTALAEDAVTSDITSDLTINDKLDGSGSFVIKDLGVLAGIEVARMVFAHVDPSLTFRTQVKDGTKIANGDIVATISGRLKSILAGERLALNFLQRLSGIAAQTALYVNEVTGTKAQIYDTRKTTPGLRDLEKYAVTMGGGVNHRRDLSDGILIKDNHLAGAATTGLTLTDVVMRAKAGASDLLVEVEVESVDQARQAIAAGADILLLDNMSTSDMHTVVEMARGNVVLEASGGVTLDRVRDIAETGVDRISVGALTHSVRSLDISLDITV